METVQRAAPAGFDGNWYDVAVLVAISIPIFTAQLEKSKEATDMANIRSAYAEVVSEYLTDDQNDHSLKVTIVSNTGDWKSGAVKLGDKSFQTLVNQAGTNGYVIVKVDKDGKVTIDDEEVKTEQVTE